MSTSVTNVAAGPPPVLANMGFTVLGIVFFCVGIGIACITAFKTMESYRKSGETLSAKAFMELVVGASLTAVFMGGGIYALIRFGGAMFGQIGIG